MMTTILSRRRVLSGLIAAPAIVAFDRIMPVKLWKPAPLSLPVKYAINGLYGHANGMERSISPAVYCWEIDWSWRVDPETLSHEELLAAYAERQETLERINENYLSALKQVS